LITKPHVGAFIRRVKNEQPAILNRQIILHFRGNPSFDAKIKVKAMPTAPLNPPYVKARTYAHLSPYPSTCSFGINIEIEKNLENVIQTYKISNLKI